jgi:hypothetical protein
VDASQLMSCAEQAAHSLGRLPGVGGGGCCIGGAAYVRPHG